MDIETIRKQVAEKGYASLTQSQKDIYNSSSQPAPTPTPAVAGTITSESLTPAPQPTLPTYKPVDLTSITEGALAGANYKPETYTTPSGAVVDAMGNIITPPPEKKAETSAPPEEKSFIERMKSLMGITGDEGLVPTPSKSAAEAYKEAYETEELKTKRAAISSLNKELADLNAQYQTLKLAEQTIPMQMQEQAEGRGITAAGLQPLTAGELRKNALAMFPVTSRILAVSAQLSGVQGDYENATKHLDTLLALQQKDRENEYQYRKDLFNFAYGVATSEEEKELRAAEKKEDREYEEKKNFQALKKDYMATATAEDDFTTATKMAMATTEEELATLLGQIKEKEKATYSTFTQDGNLYEVQKDATGRIIGTPRLIQAGVGDGDDDDKILTGEDLSRFKWTYGWTPPYGFTWGQLKQLMKDNPTATPEELEQGAKEALAQIQEQTTGQTTKETPDDVISYINSNMTDEQLEKLKEKADEAGISSMWKGKETDVKNYLNSIKDKIQQAIDAEYSQEEILEFLIK